MMALTLCGSQEGVKPCSLLNCLQSGAIVGAHGCPGLAGEGETLMWSGGGVSADIHAFARFLFSPVACGACAVRGGGACGWPDWRPGSVGPGSDGEMGVALGARR